MQYKIFLALAPVVAAATFVVGQYAWKHRTSPGARSLTWHLLVLGGFLLGNTIELATTSEAATVLWSKITYIFIVFTPVSWLAFVLEYTGREDQRKLRRFWIFAIVPVATLAMLYTNQFHHLVWVDYRFTHVGAITAIKVSYGPWFWVSASYSYLLLLGGAFLVVQSHFAAHRMYQHQSRWVLIGAAGPLVINMLYVFRVVPGWDKDFTPIGFGLCAMALAVGIFKYHLLDIVPVARASVVDNLVDGMIVLDQSGRIVDFNAAASEILHCSKQAVGRTLEEVGATGERLLAFLSAKNADSFVVSNRTGLRHYDVRQAQFLVPKSSPIASIVTLHDVTDHMQLLAEKTRLISELQAALSEIKALRGIIPICSSCKKIRDDEGYWHQVESYLADHSEVQFSHGLCNECAQRLYAEYLDDEGSTGVG
jgi:PAS domain-containing protein